MKRLKRITDLSTLVPGKKYHVECGIWRGDLPFCGTKQRGKRTIYKFVFGEYEDYLKDPDKMVYIVAVKSKLKVYEL